MTIVLFLAILVGILQGIIAISNARQGIGCGKPMDNPFTYIFMDKY